MENKFCRDCHHCQKDNLRHSVGFIIANECELWVCGRLPGEHDPVSGVRLAGDPLSPYCREERKNPEGCGPDGKYWSQTQTTGIAGCIRT